MSTSTGKIGVAPLAEDDISPRSRGTLGLAGQNAILGHNVSDHKIEA